MTIERSRPAGLPSQKDALEQHLLRDLRAVALPEPVRELHFAWCCQHLKTEHGSYRGYPSAQAAQVHTCRACPVGHQFHAYQHDRDWRFDFAWPADRLAVEVDGGTFSSGRHTRGTGYEGDCEKLNEAVLRGWRVLRVTTAMVERGDALEFVERAFGRTGPPRSSI